MLDAGTLSKDFAWQLWPGNDQLVECLYEQGENNVAQDWNSKIWDNDLRSQKGNQYFFIMEGVMYNFYPLALLLGAIVYFWLNSLDHDSELKTAKARKTL